MNPAIHIVDQSGHILYWKILCRAICHLKKKIINQSRDNNLMHLYSYIHSMDKMSIERQQGYVLEYYIENIWMVGHRHCRHHYGAISLYHFEFNPKKNICDVFCYLILMNNCFIFIRCLRMTCSSSECQPYFIILIDPFFCWILYVNSILYPPSQYKMQKRTYIIICVRLYAGNI